MRNKGTPKLETVIEYELPGIHGTPDTLYWGGRWPDDFFLGRLLSKEPPRQTNLADVFDWMANIDEIGGLSGSHSVEYVKQNLGMIYRAASIELRLDSTGDEANTRAKYKALRQSKN